MDPISNMLIMIKNASLSGKESVLVPFSKIKFSISECLAKEGYIKSVAKKVRKDHPVLELELQYIGKEPKIKEVERISKQSRRVYFGMNARKEQVGGEALFRLW